MCGWTGSSLDWGNVESGYGERLHKLRRKVWKMSDEGQRHGAAGGRAGLVDADTVQ
jgi:hypothetical protein